MIRTLRLAAIAAILALPNSVSAALAAPAVVTVTLDNQAITSDLPTNLGMAMPGGGDMSKAVMTVAASPAAVPAGEVSFTVTNRATDTVHEMILVRIDDPAKPLPFIADENRVDEDAAGHLGEVSELDPGKSGTLTLTLEKGTYMLFCNIPGHYAAGMWTTVQVQ